MTGTLILRSILAMDSYNRGYNASIDLRPIGENGALIIGADNKPIPSDKINTKIGTVTISARMR